MINIEEYIKLPLADRQKHLRLSEPCVDRGGGCYSPELKGLLAYILDTTIPYKVKVLVCHACNNSKCSNPFHIYWGTYKENHDDMMRNGGRTFWQIVVDKYGPERAKQFKYSVKGNRGGVGVPKSDEHKKKISDSVRATFQKKNAGFV